MNEDMSFYKKHCTYLPAMAGWFLFSALLSGYNKFVFGEKKMAFPCPLTLTSMHFLCQWIISYALTSSYPDVFGGREVKEMCWRTFMVVSLSCGCVTSFDVGLSNLALVHITITFYTMVKASAPIFVLLFASLLRIEQITMNLVLVILVIAIGEFLTVYGEAEFNLLGFLLCLSSSVLSGLRWTIVQFSLKTLDPPLKTALSTMRVISGSMFFSLFLFALILEQPFQTLPGSPFFSSTIDSTKTIIIGLSGAFLAVSMVLCEFYLIMKSSAIVLMIGGVVKELTTIFLGVSVFKDTLDAVNIFGCTIVFGGVLLYKILFHMKNQNGAQQPQKEEPVVLLDNNNDHISLTDYDDDDDDGEMHSIT